MAGELERIETVIEKTPLESKKFIGFLVGVGVILLILIVAGVLAHFMLLDVSLAAKAMETIVYLVTAYVGFQGAQDCVEAMKGKKS